MRIKTTITDPDFEPDHTEGGLSVLVMSLESFASFALPPEGNVTLGRAEDCEIQVTDPLASRMHARIHVGPPLQLEDLGSSNGTKLRGESIPVRAPVPLAVGETIAIGSTVLVVQTSGSAGGVRRIWSHRWFETRLVEQVSASRTSEKPFALVRLTLDNPVSWPRVVPLIERSIPSPHVFAAYGPYDYELLILGGAEAVAARVEDIRAALASLQTGIRVGMASYPRHGRNADALMEHANGQLRPRQPTAISAEIDHGGIASPEMKAVYTLAERAARSDINILILGETGVGKEVMAQSLHRLSSRASKPIVALNCAGLSETLIESELFGHQKGAFTGAIQNKKGLFEAAEGGTLFLDEIGEMPLPIQARLLRALANREILPVGSTKPRSIDARVLAATNRDLEGEVRRGSFREDLYYRLNGLVLNIPPLRERKGEILGLARLFIAEASRAADRPACVLSEAAADVLMEYHWPGNIRELKNVMERAVVLCEDATIDLPHLPLERMRAQSVAAGVARARTLPKLRRGLTSEEQDERRRIVEALEAHTWNQSRAAKALGMHRRTFVTKLDRYDIPRPRKPGRSDDVTPDEANED
jgi:two-component system response regulator AtoC